MHHSIFENLTLSPNRDWAIIELPKMNYAVSKFFFHTCITGIIDWNQTLTDLSTTYRCGHIDLIHQSQSLDHPGTMTQRIHTQCIVGSIRLNFVIIGGLHCHYTQYLSILIELYHSKQPGPKSLQMQAIGVYVRD